MKTFNTLRVIVTLVGFGMLIGAFFHSRARQRFLKSQQPSQAL